MKIYIIDRGDPSVGIFGQAFEIDTTFEKEDVDNETLENFRKEIGMIYSEYSDFVANPIYDFEQEELQKRYLEDINSDSN